jgi:hypothetical protein
MIAVKKATEQSVHCSYSWTASTMLVDDTTLLSGIPSNSLRAEAMSPALTYSDTMKSYVKEEASPAPTQSPKARSRSAVRANVALAVRRFDATRPERRAL